MKLGDVKMKREVFVSYQDDIIYSNKNVHFNLKIVRKAK
jgi:hypothetical protein